MYSYFVGLDTRNNDPEAEFFYMIPHTCDRFFILFSFDKTLFFYKSFKMSENLTAANLIGTYSDVSIIY